MLNITEKETLCPVKQFCKLVSTSSEKSSQTSNIKPYDYLLVGDQGQVF